MTFDDLAGAPYNLDAHDIQCVRETLAGLSEDDRLSQLFNLMLFGNDPV